MALTRAQKSALAWEVQSAAVELLAARHDDGNVDESLQNVEWEELAEQMAVWFMRLPGDTWHASLPRLWERG